jgi:hypothetical protein
MKYPWQTMRSPNKIQFLNTSEDVTTVMAVFETVAAVFLSTSSGFSPFFPHRPGFLTLVWVLFREITVPKIDPGYQKPEGESKVIYFTLTIFSLLISIRLFSFENFSGKKTLL